MTFFFRYMRPLVVPAMSILLVRHFYRVSDKEVHYAYDAGDVDIIKEQTGWNNPKLQRFKGLGEMNSD